MPLFDRLPEIYRIRDAEQSPPDQLRAYLGADRDGVRRTARRTSTQLYDDLFIDTCDDWVIPYIADLLGTTHLKGEPRTLRADVADTIALRRRKGTLGAIERLAVNLTGWACRGVELRENLAWTQHLNHQRPDAGGAPPYGSDDASRASRAARRHRAGPRSGGAGAARHAVRPLRLHRRRQAARSTTRGTSTCRTSRSSCGGWPPTACALTQPLAKGVTDLGAADPPGLARFAVRFDLHPLDLPVRLFNTSRPGFRATGTSAASSRR